jgi:hypothetical protein
MWLGVFFLLWVLSVAEESPPRAAGYLMPRLIVLALPRRRSRPHHHA